MNQGGILCENIIFIGMPGAGKTTIGKEVARTLAWPFFDSDVRLREGSIETSRNYFGKARQPFARRKQRPCGNFVKKRGLFFPAAVALSKRPRMWLFLNMGASSFFWTVPLRPSHRPWTRWDGRFFLHQKSPQRAL